MQENRQEKSLIKQNISLYLAKKGVSDYEYYKVSGTTRGILGQNNGISEDNISRFLAYAPDVNHEWLLTGKGAMLKTKDSNQSCSVAEDIIPDPKDKKNKAIYPKKQGENSITEVIRSEPSVSYTLSKGAPYYDVDFLGGFDLTFNDQTVTPEYNIDFKPFNKPGVTWVNITGHSMEPKINHGDIIALKECRLEDVQYGEIYAVVLDTIRTVKILRKSKNPDRMRYVPINEENYDEQEYDNSRILRIFEVLGNISRFM
nr:MAG TPA: LexA-like protein [Caudoviricetes sp.]